VPPHLVGLERVSKALAELEQSLAERRRPDGAFGSAAGAGADTESSALALLALHALGDPKGPGARGAHAWLAARQRADGAWPLTDAVPEPSWASAWAALALARHGAPTEPLARAARWLVAREGRRPGLLARAVGLLRNQHGSMEQDPTLRGWPWHEMAVSWVEPTATALLALRHLEPRTSVAGARERIEEGERLLWDRICVDGGWNYGNRRALGVALHPFPDTTAIALLALQHSTRKDGLARGCAALERLLDVHASSLALGLGALAFELQGRDSAPLRERLAARIGELGAPAETRSVAFALLALGGGAELLRVPA
jgi:hypothetical protein